MYPMKRDVYCRPVDKRVQAAVRERQLRRRRESILRAGIASNNTAAPTSNNTVTRSPRPPFRVPTTTQTVLQFVPRLLIGALSEAESRAEAAEQHLADIRSNVDQLQTLLEQFQERASRAGILTRETTVDLNRNGGLEELSRNMADMTAMGSTRNTTGMGQRTRTSRGTHGHGRRAHRVNEGVLPTEDFPGMRIVPHDVVGNGTNVTVEIPVSNQQSSEGSGIDSEMAEARNRQWEELRRRLASRVRRSEE